MRMREIIAVAIHLLRIMIVMRMRFKCVHRAATRNGCSHCTQWVYSAPPPHPVGVFTAPPPHPLGVLTPAKGGTRGIEGPEITEETTIREMDGKAEGEEKETRHLKINRLPQVLHVLVHASSHATPATLVYQTNGRKIEEKEYKNIYIKLLTLACV